MPKKRRLKHINRNIIIITIINVVYITIIYGVYGLGSAADSHYHSSELPPISRPGSQPDLWPTPMDFDDAMRRCIQDQLDDLRRRLMDEIMGVVQTRLSTQDLDLRRQLQDLIIRAREYGID